MDQYLITAWDYTDKDALERRMKVRPFHFIRAKELKEAGNFIHGGAMLDENGLMIGSTMVVQFETRENLQLWLDTEPYVNQKVWEKIEINLFRVAEV